MKRRSSDVATEAQIHAELTPVGRMATQEGRKRHGMSNPAVARVTALLLAEERATPEMLPELAMHTWLEGRMDQ